MSRFSAHRIQRLEALYHGGSCPYCGSGDVDPVDYEVVWDDVEADESSASEAEEEFCEYCGRQTTYVVMWHDTDLDLSPQPVGKGSRYGGSRL
jgi:hypothetical protein